MRLIERSWFIFIHRSSIILWRVGFVAGYSWLTSRACTKNYLHIPIDINKLYNDNEIVHLRNHHRVAQCEIHLVSLCGFCTPVIFPHPLLPYSRRVSVARSEWLTEIENCLDEGRRLYLRVCWIYLANCLVLCTALRVDARHLFPYPNLHHKTEVYVSIHTRRSLITYICACFYRNSLGIC